jgi:hypothetical protein
VAASALVSRCTRFFYYERAALSGYSASERLQPAYGVTS